MAGRCSCEIDNLVGWFQSSGSTAGVGVPICKHASYPVFLGSSMVKARPRKAESKLGGSAMNDGAVDFVQ